MGLGLIILVRWLAAGESPGRWVRLSLQIDLSARGTAASWCLCWGDGSLSSGHSPGLSRIILQNRSGSAASLHTVMEPELVTYQHSPHAKVACTECHIGPGAAW